MIKENFIKIRNEITTNVELVVATKARTIAEIQEVISAGATIIGENYVKEAGEKYAVIGSKVKWHLIGHLQRNKVKDAVKIFDMMESLDSLDLAATINKECRKVQKIMPVLIEINCAAEYQKAGILPEDFNAFMEDVLKLKTIKPMGLMTMGPLLKNSQDLRSYFEKTRQIFEKAKKIFALD
ncbi:MAG: YggS family pyridoxal phosphate-dependent enzyme, partial [Candidatus Omnitrophica bacterium]|nr:YggS family pyridoxal phosphate-dependent enzyme [Candidatus Omnitrophota bacterium]